MTDFSPEQQKVADMLKSMKECIEGLKPTNSMRNPIEEAFNQLRDTFASRVARDLINDKLMFKKVY